MKYDLEQVESITFEYSDEGLEKLRVFADNPDITREKRNYPHAIGFAKIPLVGEQYTSGEYFSILEGSYLLKNDMGVFPKLTSLKIFWPHKKP